jgi:hypothetical protein
MLNVQNRTSKLRIRIQDFRKSAPLLVNVEPYTAMAKYPALIETTTWQGTTEFGVCNVSAPSRCQAATKAPLTKYRE